MPFASRIKQDVEGQVRKRNPAFSREYGTLQAKLAVGIPGDEHEEQADRVAEQVMRMPTPKLRRTCACGGTCPNCQANQSGSGIERMQTSRTGQSGSEQAEAPPIVHDVLRSPGRRLDPTTLEFMEQRFGQDFDGVRIHTNDRASESAEAIDARAYTVGNNIVFGEGQFNPGAQSGRLLLAHELAHTIQQKGGGPAIQRQGHQDPCRYAGPADKEREIHLNLTKRSIRVYRRGGGHTQFDHVVTGPRTEALGRANDFCHMYSVKGHQTRSSHGLINFVNYCGDFGFHSNYHEQDGHIVPLLGSQSHGCARLHDSDEHSTRIGDSRRFYNLVRDDDCVRIYTVNFWRSPTFRRCPPSGEDCSPR